MTRLIARFSRRSQPRFVRPDQEEAVLLMRQRLLKLRERYPEAADFLGIGPDTQLVA